MQILSLGRKRFTASEKAKILRSYHGTQLSQEQFAARAGISVSALQNWLRQSRAAEAGGTSAFIAIPNLLAPAPKQSFCYRLQLPGDLNLEIAVGFAPGEVAELCRLLKNL